MEELEQKNNYTRNTDLEQLFQPLLKNDILLEFIVSEINYRKKKELGKGLF